MRIIINIRKGASVADKGRINNNVKEMAKCYPEAIDSVEYDNQEQG